MSDLVVGIMSFEAFKAHTVAIASGTEQATALLWFADLAAFGAVVNNAVLRWQDTDLSLIERNRLARLNLLPENETIWRRIVLQMAEPGRPAPEDRP